MLKIYGNKPQRVMRCLWALEELGLDYEQVSVPDKSAESFRTLNPAGKTPVLVDGDFLLTESCAINRYLAALKPGPLLPDDDRTAALIDQWTSWAITEIEFHFTVMVREMRRAENAGEMADKAVIGQCLNDITDTLAVLEGHLANGNAYVAGDRFTIGDINACFPVSGIVGKIDMGPFPKVADWVTRCTSRDAWKRVVAIDESRLSKL
jgi:glutathione S-transferase